MPNDRCTDLEQIFNASGDLQVVIDSDYTIKRINTAYLLYLGIDRERAVNSRCHEILKGRFCGTSHCPLVRVTKENGVIEAELAKKGAGDSSAPFLLTATPLHGPDNRVEGMIASFKSLSSLKASEHRLQRVFKGTIHAIADMVEIRDPYTAGHQERVAKIAGMIARKMKLGPDRVDTIETAAILHDIGKIYVPTEFLTKPGKLSNTEFEIIKTHSMKGADILTSIPFDSPISSIVHQHHERMDGSGYPLGLKADEILLEARVISVADVVEAISSHRPYRRSLGINTALEEIRRGRGTKYDKEGVEACCNLAGEIYRILEPEARDKNRANEQSEKGWPGFKGP